MIVDITNSFLYNHKPFPNLIKDDFLDPDEFKVVNSIVDKINKIINTLGFDFSNKEHSLSSIYDKDSANSSNTNISLLSEGAVRRDVIHDLPDLKSLQYPDGFIELLYDKYNDIFLKLLKKLDSKKLKFYDYTHIAIASTGKSFTSIVHDDALWKLLSVVTYLSPTNNIGTNLFECTSKEGWQKSKKLKGPFEIKWKVNRAFIFSPRQGFTPHSYKSNGIDHRHALTFNLCTRSDPREIKKAEDLIDSSKTFPIPSLDFY